MKLHQDDPRITAYILGELPPEQALSIEHAAAGDPALRLLLIQAERTQTQLRELLGGGMDELLPRQRDNIRRAAREAARMGKIEQLASHRQAKRSWFVPLAAAAAIASGIFVLTQIPGIGRGGKGVAGNHVNGNRPDKMPDTVSRDGKGNSMKLPLRVGTESLAKVSAAVRVAGRKPTSEEVSIPEMLNAFPLKASGAVALKGGCKLGAEVIPCPWKPSGSLVFVEVRGAKDGERALSVEFRADPESVIDHRIIGYHASSGESGVSASSSMSANAAMLLVIEVNAKAPKLGALVWSVDGSEAPAVPLVIDSEKEPSDDARFAALVCGFGLWLRGEERASLDEAMVLGLAREVAADGLVADRYDFLDLVDQAIKVTKE